MPWRRTFTALKFGLVIAEALTGKPKAEMVAGQMLYY